MFGSREPQWQVMLHCSEAHVGMHIKCHAQAQRWGLL